MGLSGEDWRLILLAVIAAVQAIAILVIPLWVNRHRAEDKEERAVVAAKVNQTADAVTEVHAIVNSRYDELKAELVKSNERVVRLLAALAKVAEDHAPAVSAVIAVPVPKNLNALVRRLKPKPKKKRRG